VAVKLPNSKFYIGQGSSKKDAEQNAAFLCFNNNSKS
jgi:ribonuclease-3